MRTIRHADERGHADHGWLNTYHTFSFADYYDPAYMGFRSLLVMNEDRVAPGKGFPQHGHRDMEIVSYVLSGALEHKDSLGHQAVLRPGEFQRITAGTGIKHAEFNPASDEPVHFYQIWLVPFEEGLPPSYEQKAFPESEKQGRLRLVASPQGSEGSLTIRQNANIYLATLADGQSVRHAFAEERHGWLQVLRGAVTANGTALRTSDGLAVSREPALEIKAQGPTEIMLFDLA